MSYKTIIRRLVDSRDNHFSGESYKFGRKNSLNKIEVLLVLTQKHGISSDDVIPAREYLDKLVGEKIKEQRESGITNGKPKDLENWKDGGPYPEFIRPIDMAVLLFQTLDVATSGTLKFSKNRGVPIWMHVVNPGLHPKDRVKEHDVRSGLAEEIRRYRRERSENEKDALHSLTVDEVMVCRDSVTSYIRKMERERIAKDIAYDKKLKKKGLIELLKYIKNYNSPKTTDYSKNMHMLHLTMICHWIWQVKRRLNGFATVHEIALIFLGRQGIGKSYSVKKLISVVENLATPASVTNLVDERETRRWENYFIAFLDEVSKESKDSLSKLKDWVTKSEAEFRPLHTNSVEACDKNAQAIGTSNFPLTSILKDPTGMRRFWQVPSDQEQNKLFEGMENIDWYLIYKAIDENNPEGYYGPQSIGKKHYAEILNIQNSARDKTPVEEYLYIHNYLDIKGNLRDDVKRDWFDISILKEEFNLWCQMNAWGEYTPKAFRYELQGMHLELKRKTANNLYVELNVPEDLKPENQINDESVGFENE